MHQRLALFRRWLLLRGWRHHAGVEFEYHLFKQRAILLQGFRVDAFQREAAREVFIVVAVQAISINQIPLLAGSSQRIGLGSDQRCVQQQHNNTAECRQVEVSWHGGSHINQARRPKRRISVTCGSVPSHAVRRNRSALPQAASKSAVGLPARNSGSELPW